MENIEGEHITLTFGESEDVECEIGDTFYFENKLYIYLFPMDSTNDVYIYRFKFIDNDGFELIDIEDDDEFEKVSAYWKKIHSDDELEIQIENDKIEEYEEFQIALNNLDSL